MSAMRKAGRRKPRARTTRLELPRRKAVRRTHAERTAETRAKVIAAVIDGIAENGFQATTAQAIAQRAGVTWGAVQHHFDGKDGLLRAVLEETFVRFADRLGEVPSKGASLDERVSWFVDRAWEHFRSRHFRSTFEILLNYLGREHHTDADAWRAEMTRAWDRVWTRIFGDVKLSRHRSLMIQHFTISTLSGLAATLMMGHAGAELPPQELDLVKRTLVAELGGSRRE
jgi:AcrR family transcriptional regulator